MSQPSLTDVISWCQDWFWKNPKSLQCQIDALSKRITALEGVKIGIADVRAQLHAETDKLSDALKKSP